MTLAAARRRLGATPRAVLLVLLAFGVEITPPPSPVLQHRHGLAETEHVHVGRIGRASRIDLAAMQVHSAAEGAGAGRARVDDDSRAWRTAGTRGAHRHFAAFLAVGALPSSAGLRPRTVVMWLPETVVPDEAAAVLGVGRARSPPSRDL